MFEPDVPFPAEDLGTCRGCKAQIGWVRYEDDQGRERAHPVDPKGYAGVECGTGTDGCKVGWTLTGTRTAVLPPPTQTLFAIPLKDLTVVFPSHFASCPERAQFYGARR